jgi:glycine/D-amino acid oxidase-like deaminating enzyme
VRDRPDVVVVGLALFGVWTALLLRERGHEVTLLDAYGPGNSRSASGDTRFNRPQPPTWTDGGVRRRHGSQPIDRRWRAAGGPDSHIGWRARRSADSPGNVSADDTSNRLERMFCGTFIHAANHRQRFMSSSRRR